MYCELYNHTHKQFEVQYHIPIIPFEELLDSTSVNKSPAAPPPPPP